MVIHSSTSGVPRDFVAGNGVTSPPPRLTPSRTFRTTRRPDTRVVLGAGLALLSLAALGIGLSQEVPGTQAVLRVTHDLPADAVLQADDISVARVSLPQDVAATTFSSNQVDQVVGQRLVASLKGGQLLAPTTLAQRRTRVPSGRIEVTVPIEPYAGSGGRLSPNDTVIVFGTPRQTGSAASAPAEVIVPRARIVDVGRPDSGASVLSGGSTASSRTTWITLDLAEDEAARVSAAAHTDYLDVDVVATGEPAQ
jgi:Flp pilus assembly protein CpaB